MAALVSEPDPKDVASAARPRGCTNLRLHQLMRRVDQLYDAELSAAALRTSQYGLLSHVLRLGPIGPGDLARAMKMQPSTLSRNLRPLLQAGWLALGPGPDARSRRVQVTPEGVARHALAYPHWRRAQQQLNTMLGDDRVAGLHTLLDDCLIRLQPAGRSTPATESP